MAGTKRKHARGAHEPGGASSGSETSSRALGAAHAESPRAPQLASATAPRRVPPRVAVNDTRKGEPRRAGDSQRVRASRIDGGAEHAHAAESAADCLVPPGCDWTVILGIDPGTRNLGYGAIVLAPDGPRLLIAGVIQPPGPDLPRRLGAIAAELPRVLARCRPHWVVVERAYSAVNVQSAFRIGESRGVVLACAAACGAAVAEYSPAQAKKAVLGHGGASKEQVAAMVPRLLRRELGALPLDATDALALALTQARALERANLARPAPRVVG